MILFHLFSKENRDCYTDYTERKWWEVPIWWSVPGGFMVWTERAQIQLWCSELTHGLTELHVALHGGVGDWYLPSSLNCTSTLTVRHHRISPLFCISVFIFLTRVFFIVLFSHNSCTLWTPEKFFHKSIYPWRGEGVHITLQCVPYGRGSQSAMTLITIS